MRGFLVLSLILFSVVGSSVAMAEISLGSSFSSATSGRTIPGLYAAYEGETWAASVNSVGVQTTLYYHSAWTVGFFFDAWEPEEFLWGQMFAGIGASAYFAKKGYKENEDAAVVENDDWSLGPSFRVGWQFLFPMYMAIEGMYGIRTTAIIFLSSQDIVTFTAGVRF